MSLGSIRVSPAVGWGNKQLNILRYAANKAVSKKYQNGIRARKSYQVQSLLKKKAGLEVIWGQDTVEVFIGVPVDLGVHKRDINFEIHPKRLKLYVKNEMMLEGSLEDVGDIDKNYCFWTVEERDGIRMVVIYIKKAEMGHNSWQALLESEVPDTTITTNVYLNIEIAGQNCGKIVIGLFGNEVPKTVENFRCLCTGEKGVGSQGKELTYKGSKFHRIIDGFMAQGGDITHGDGTGGESIYGDQFEDERMFIEHTQPGLVSMANKGPDTNSSQFFIVFDEAPHLDNNHVVFGEVVQGMQIVSRLEGIGSEDGTPKAEAVITDCGEVQNEDQLREFEQERRQLAVDLASTESRMQLQ
eukprot:TRINITY_DN8502_c0_g2_i3.p1 TRINITY_DN8502_c0_g2~~TRINITY_DN8502_c0_g2_i3.p1  ORF type:complete len:356 (+),score=53.95 TRINITY_DN8502_c0_g2_i3:118-1185(+)